MTISDRDLRDALEGLPGDPTEDAARVLAALPAGPPGTAGPGGPLPPLAWWIAAGALAAGLALGLAIGGFGASPAAGEPPAVAPKEGAPDGARKDDENDEKAKAKKKDDPGKTPPTYRNGAQLFTFFGAVRVTEPNAAPRPLTGHYMVEAGAVYETDTWSMAGLLLPEDVIARLKSETRAAALSSNRLRLDYGTLWVASAWSGVVRVKTDLGDVDVAQGAALITRADDELVVIAVKGTATVHAAEHDAARARGGQRVIVRRNGELVEPEDAGFLGRELEWMHPCLRLQNDDTELKDRVAYLVDAYVEGTHRDAAEQQIHHLGEDCVRRLVEELRSPDMRPNRFRRDVARLISNVAGVRSVVSQFQALKDLDPLVRVNIYHGLARVTGDEDRGEQFYRDASIDEIVEAADAWMRRFFRR